MAQLERHACRGAGLFQSMVRLQHEEVHSGGHERLNLLGIHVLSLCHGELAQGLHQLAGGPNGTSHPGVVAGHLARKGNATLIELGDAAAEAALAQSDPVGAKGVCGEVLCARLEIG